ARVGDSGDYIDDDAACGQPGADALTRGHRAAGRERLERQLSGRRPMNRPRPRARPTTPARPAAEHAPSLPIARIRGIDALRGGALCLMFVYHFAFDLRFYRVFAADFEHDPFWLGFRALIVTSFLLLVGVSLVLAERRGASVAHFWKRVGVIAACAL